MNWKYLYFDPEGRIGRKWFWLGSIIFVIAPMGAGIVDVLLGFDPNNFGLVSFIVWLVTLYPYVVLLAKRWHDRGKSGKWTLISLIPLLGPFWIVVELGFLKGTPGPNQYGPVPVRA